MYSKIKSEIKTDKFLKNCLNGKGLMLETSTLSTQVIKPNCLVIQKVITDLKNCLNGKGSTLETSTLPTQVIKPNCLVIRKLIS